MQNYCLKNSGSFQSINAITYNLEKSYSNFENLRIYITFNYKHSKYVNISDFVYKIGIVYD